MPLLKTGQEVSDAANKAKAEIATNGTNGNEEAFQAEVFMVV